MAEDNSWVFDSLVCFLHGPVWNAPLQTFIEEKSLIFDPNIQPNESNPEYTKIHDEYKNLVDFMLGSFMEEMQITPEQFEMACLEGRTQKGEGSFNFHQGLFQQIWAANDIKMFIRMMTQRNVEIQLQALDLIERRQQSMSSEKDDHQEEAALKEETLEEFPEAEEIIAKSVEKDFDTPEAALTPDEPEVSDKFERLNIFFEHQKIDPEDIQSRQQYLREQRDKIIAIKKKTRAKQLNDSAEKSDRPSSAQVAQKILDGNSEELLGGAGNSERNSASMQLRKTLARRLRTEVVEQQF